jgi:hypothetical protein
MQAFGSLPEGRETWNNLMLGFPGSHYINQMQVVEAIGKLPQLQHLELKGMHWAGYTTARLPQYFTALTASEHLTVLVFDGAGCCGFGNLFKPQALQDMMPMGHQLSQLQCLKLARCPPVPGTQRLTAGLVEPCCEPFDAAMAHVAQCCPNLCQLDLHQVISSTAVQHLLQLKKLTALTVSSDAVDDSGAAAVAQMTQLRSLKCLACRGDAPGLSFSALQQWTALKGLTSLSARCQEMQFTRKPKGWPGAVVELRATHEVST